jgi:argininosuccinate lyase
MSETLWGGRLAADVEAYTTAEDRGWDARLLVWDLLGTLAHIEGIAAAGLLTARERDRLRAAVRALLREARGGRFAIGEGDEDVHSAIEKALVRRLGALGEKVHAGRSRNDQVAVDIRLFLKDRLLAVADRTLATAGALAAFAWRHRHVVFPGYTHLRRAMPSTIGLWAAGYAESLLDDLVLLEAALGLADRSPLGSAAGYGVPVPIDRERVARRLGFAGVQRVVTSVQTLRGKLEAAVLAALWAIGHDLGKLAWDVVLFSAEEYGFLRMPAELATGSSIMPHKRNPDVFELTRGRSRQLEGLAVQAMAIAGGLPGGYHRDLQLTKGPVMAGLDTVAAMLATVSAAVPQLAVDRAACRAALAPDLLATDEVFRRVRNGATFRSAYREVAADAAAARLPAPPADAEILAVRRSPGNAGDPDLGGVASAIRGERRRWRARRRRFDAALAVLEGGTR